MNDVRITPDYPSSTLAAAIAGKHLGFCGRLAAARRRVGARRPAVQRVFARIAAVRRLGSSVYAPTFATTVMSGPRLQLTLAPSIRVDLHSTASIAPPVLSLPFQVGSPTPFVIGRRPRQCATTVLMRAETGPDRSGFDSALPALAPLLRQVVERPHRAELPLVTRAIASLRRSDVRRVETIARLPPPTVQAKTHATPASSPHSEVRRTIPWAARSQAMAVPGEIPDAEVARLTERVVRQINRRILAERERRGR